MKKTLVATLALAALLVAGNTVLAHCGKCGTPAPAEKKSCDHGEKAGACKHGEGQMASFKAVEEDLASWDKKIGDAAFQKGVAGHAKALVDARAACQKSCAKSGADKAAKACCPEAEKMTASFKALEASLPKMGTSLGDAAFQKEVYASLKGIADGRAACQKACSAKASGEKAGCSHGATSEKASAGCAKSCDKPCTGSKT